MKHVALAGRSVAAAGFGAMNLSHAYQPRPERETAVRLLNEALDAGFDHMDTATLYGGGENERLLADAIMHRRHEFQLASKCGMFKGREGKEINGRPEVLRRHCEESLSRLKTDHIDLYYLHRWDKSVPIEDSIGTLGDLRREGKIGAIGLSEVSADTLRRAHKEHPVAAIQSEYSLLTRNPEIGVLDACDELGVRFVAFSPNGRGMLADHPVELSELPGGDMRHKQPRFQPEHMQNNRPLLNRLREMARSLDLTASQLAQAWLLHQRDFIMTLAGTTKASHMRDNLAVAGVSLPTEMVAELSELFDPQKISGPRKSAATRHETDTEEFDWEQQN